MTADGRAPALLRWAIAATPALPVIVLLGWHPRSRLESAEPGGIDIALVALIAAVVVSVVLAVVLASVDERQSRSERMHQRIRGRLALLGVPVYLAGRAVAGERAYRAPFLVSAAVTLVGVIVVVQKLVDAAPLLN